MSAPKEVWARKLKSGGWEFSFDQPYKRHELKLTRLVNEAELLKADALNAELAAALERIANPDNYYRGRWCAPESCPDEIARDALAKAGGGT